MELAREQLEELTKTILKLQTRAEQISDPADVFVETVFLETLRANKNQTINGRRGTGKTHLLRRFASDLWNEFGESKQIPIIIDGLTLRDNAIATSGSHSTMAFSLYVEFVRQLTKALFELLESRTNPGFWDAILGGSESQKAKRARPIANDLSDLLQKGEVLYIPGGKASLTSHSLAKIIDSTSLGIGLNLSDPRNIGWKLNVGSDWNAKLEESEISTVESNGQIVLPFTTVASKVSELLDLLDDASLVILFDEWSSVSMYLDVQPHLADMFKRTLTSIPKMTIKIACIPTRTRLATPISLESPIPLGYEVGDDIFGDIDLDTAVFTSNELERVMPFFFSLLKKHVGANLEWVEEMSNGEFEDAVTENVMSLDVFAELCLASAGIPRDFLELVINSFQIQQIGSPDEEEFEKLSMRTIRLASNRMYKSKNLQLLPGSKQSLFLLEVFRKITGPNKTTLFLVPEEFEQHEIIRILWDERLIHSLPASHYDHKSFRTYRYFQMDYGRFFEILGDAAGKEGEKHGVQLASKIPINDWLGLSWIKKAAEFALPRISSWCAKVNSIANHPKMTDCPDPQKIILDDAFFPTEQQAKDESSDLIKQMLSKLA